MNVEQFLLVKVIQTERGHRYYIDDDRCAAEGK